MRKFLLPIELYFDVHPILELDSINKINYIEILKSILEPNFLNNEWKKQLFSIYKNKFDYIPKKNPISIRQMSYNYNYFKFRYWLLLDSLFIAGFSDKTIGNKILNKFKKFYSPVMYDRVKEFDYIYNFFYDFKKSNIFFNKYPFLDSLKNYWYTIFEIAKFPLINEEINFVDDIINSFCSLFVTNKRVQQDVFNIIWKNRRFLAQKEKNIIVTGTMSAGKSTFINALIGKNILKTKLSSCTAKNHFIHNKSGEDGFTYKYDKYLTLNATNEDLLTNNSENKSNIISIVTKFRLFTNINDRLCVIDTPGINSDRNLDHKDITQNIITMEHQKDDLMIFLINGHHPLTDDEKNHLINIKNNYSGKIVFFINKVDMYDPEEDTIEEVIKDTKILLENIGFKNNLVFPISSKAGYLAKRKIFDDDLNKDELNDLNILTLKFKEEYFQFDKYFRAFDKLSNFADIENDDYKKVLLHSGIISIENIIGNY